jgi:hypothetical protein
MDEGERSALFYELMSLIMSGVRSKLGKTMALTKQLTFTLGLKLVMRFLEDDDINKQ